MLKRNIDRQTDRQTRRTDEMDRRDRQTDEMDRRDQRTDIYPKMIMIAFFSKS